MNSLQLATVYLEASLKGKYVTLQHIAPLLEKLKSVFSVEEIGKSIENRSICQIKIGTGPKKILLWSQMHGNEPTTTKGLFDFINFLASPNLEAEEIKKNYTLLCIPILNPDGAFYYTRENAAKIDLNRDAFLASQPEMKILHAIYKNFNPDFCYNMHDQRTLFGTEGFHQPATISFLAPAYNEARSFNTTRIKAITIINKMYEELQQYIPNQIGRFDDSFNINCTGDYFTNQGIPTILFEAGHFPNDYNREISRKYVFISLFISLKKSYENVVVDTEIENYLRIPQNNKCFFDFIYKKIKIIDNCVEKIITFAAQYQEVLQDDTILFKAIISQIDNLEANFGHIEYDGQEMLFEANGVNFPKIGEEATFSLNKVTKFDNGIEIISKFA